MNQTPSLKTGYDEKKGSVFASETVMKGFASEPQLTISRASHLDKHSSLCEKATHKDCTCPCNGLFHGVRSVQQKLLVFS